jgi:hypothetical protein
VRILIILTVAVALLLTGCSTPSSTAEVSIPEETPIIAEEVPITAVDTSTTTAESKFVTRYILVSSVPKINTEKTIGMDGVFPDETSMGNVGYGDELSTWTTDIPALGITKGQLLALYIFNRTGEELSYSVNYMRPNEIIRDNDKNEYVPAPFILSLNAKGDSSWMVLSDSVVKVPSEMVAVVAVKINIPQKDSGLVLPKRWAFQLQITPSQSGSIWRAFRPNWLIEMK